MKPPHGPDIVARTWEILRQLYGMTEPQIEVLLAAANTRARLEELTSLWEVRFRRALIQAEDELSAPPTLAEIYANISNEADDHS